MSPQVSVIITTFNRAAMVTEAVESVLAQEMTDFELSLLLTMAPPTKRKKDYLSLAPVSNITSRKMRE